MRIDVLRSYIILCTDSKQKGNLRFFFFIFSDFFVFYFCDRLLFLFLFRRSLYMRRHIPKMLLPRLLLASGLSRSCVRVTLSRLDTLGEAADNAGEEEKARGYVCMLPLVKQQVRKMNTVFITRMTTVVGINLSINNYRRYDLSCPSIIYSCDDDGE